MRIPEGLFAESDGAALTRQGIKGAAGDQREDPGDAEKREEPPGRIEPGDRGIGLAPVVPDGGGPFGAVPGHHRADDRRDLMAVAGRLQAEPTERREQEQPERTDRPVRRARGRRSTFFGRLTLPAGVAAGLVRDRRTTEPDPDPPADRDKEASARGPSSSGAVAARGWRAPPRG